jgi:hypothetical protein
MSGADTASRALPAYRLEVPELAEQIAVCTIAPDHRMLLAEIRKHFPDARIIATRGGYWLDKAKVLTREGELVHDDRRAFLQAQLDLHAGDAAATWKALQVRDLVCTRCDVEYLHLIHHADGVTQENFIQLDVRVESERVFRGLIQESWWSSPRDLRDLEQAEGYELPEAEMRSTGPGRYALSKVVAMRAFSEDAARCHAAYLDRTRNKMITVTDLYPGRPSVTRTLPHSEFAPAAYLRPWSGQRMFDDWRESSAGRGGHLISDHWAFDTSDYTAPDGVRSMQFIPMWAGPEQIAVAAMDDAPEEFAELAARMNEIDQLVGCPFAWYFFALHGNRLGGWAIERVIEAAEAGRFDLPEHDYRVLKRWQAASYSF